MITNVIVEKFLNDMKERRTNRLAEIIENINEAFLENTNIICNCFSGLMLEIINKYNSLYSEKLVGDLRWIYISYMRTSILDHYPIYRIDFYDENERTSLIECADYWDFDYVFKHLYILRNELEKEFLNQTKVGLYKLDELVIGAADSLHIVAMELLPEILKMYLEQSEEVSFLKDNKVKIMGGEFFDKAKLLFDCGLCLEK